jgi:hypothetical protein
MKCPEAPTVVRSRSATAIFAFRTALISRLSFFVYNYRGGLAPKPGSISGRGVVWSGAGVIVSCARLALQELNKMQPPGGEASVPG